MVDFIDSSMRAERESATNWVYSRGLSWDQMDSGGQGFALHERVFSNQECDALLDATASFPLRRSRAGARHLLAHPAIAALASDSRLLVISREHLGRRAIPFRATLFEKSTATNWLIPWHQDTALPLAAPFEAAGWGPWSVKAGTHYAHAPASALERVIALRVHLDACTSGNGPLRVIPHSHRNGVLTDEEVLEYVAGHDAVESHAPRGGVIAMRPLLIHSSSKAQKSGPRRVLHIEYADSL